MTASLHKPHLQKPDFNITANGDCALDIRFSAEPSEELSRYIIGLRQYIQEQGPDDLIDLIPAYQCLTISFDPLTHESESLSQELRALTQKYLKIPAKLDRDSRIIRIPVCYEEAFAPDMHMLSEHTGLTPKQVARLHTDTAYLVHMLGFSPGFLYLGGLDPRLHCPRKEKPRLRVPAGAVGIGGNQTGIYPQATAGGWQIIGQTPLRLFQPSSDSPFIAEPLDIVKFYSIGKSEFETIAQQAQYESAKERPI
ncbi:5-oxoprolinase subunit PxpB [Microbulbifer sp. GL-2]|uniref:5-oxoprolinase subunit PxpB n=1 Tax=Microbulbifer sp. GL-2 TaxID=2591606 RepID=UPI00116478E5|nr:5-oxoprolinase subunit PxpB [Microbulbifer sp. GL-2]BBM00737.1 kinase A inhibitor [Microbulbifer sp. GL-2]